MADRIIDDVILTSIADAVRAKTGETDLIIPEDMPDKVTACYDAGYADNQLNLDAVLNRSVTSVRVEGTSISTYALSYCRKLVHVDAPNVLSLGTRAISECDALEMLDFPKLTSIGTNALVANDKLTTVILRAETVCTLATAASITSKATIYVSDELLDSYKAASKWSDIADRIKPISELEG